MSCRVGSVEYVPSLEVFEMSDGFGIEWTSKRGYSGQVQYRSPQDVLDAVTEWMERHTASSESNTGTEQK